MLVIFLPLTQSKLKLFDLKPLKGDVSYPEQVHFSINDWFTSNYQEKKEIYLNAMFGFRSTCIRINNQIAYVLFNKANANGVIIGKDEFLYEESYINAYTGNDFLGQESIDSTLYKLKYVTDTLNKLNKKLVVVFAAGKASFFSEYIPNEYLKNKSNTTNYNSFSEGSKKLALNVIDFNSWFILNKNNSKYPLYPKQGIHWSRYGMALAADSLIKKIENLTNTPIAQTTYNELVIEQPHDEDCDIGDGMNLLVDFKSFDMAYPKVIFNTSETKNKLNLLMVADSYYWGIYNYGISNCFNTSHFWYYNKQIYPESASKELLTDQVNTGDELLKHDVIVIMATEANLKNLGWGFIEKAYAYFKRAQSVQESKLISVEKINDWKEYIKKDAKWMEVVKLNASKKNISIDSALTLDAKWQAEQQK